MNKSNKQDEGASMDCPELELPDDDDLCLPCLLKRNVAIELNEIEGALTFSLDCGALRKRPDSGANDAIGYALSCVDNLRFILDINDGE